MKRILIVDASTAVRETLAFILAREFEVLERQDTSGLGLAPLINIDLLILGAPPGSGETPPALTQVLSHVSCPVLILFDSRPPIGFDARAAGLDWLTKPFNPYELKEKISHLLSKSQAELDQNQPFIATKSDSLTRYLSYPYLPVPVAELARKFAVFPVPIMILGEIGCGQENVARAIYAAAPKAGPWVPIYPADGIADLGLEALEIGAAQRAFTLFLSGVEGLSIPGQASLLRFLERHEDSGREIWVLSTTSVDLLERVYQKEFLEPLYYRLATLTLRIPPLRDRPGDLLPLAAGIAEAHARRMNAESVTFTSGALERMRHYLWFGNVKELESVITRTLVVHRKNPVEASDLVWDTVEGGTSPGEVPGEPSESGSGPHGVAGRNGPPLDLRVLINELAHELKNPMVTIKTFAQLLAERFDDVAFRSQFQVRVGLDIARMDEVLELLVDFSRFNRARAEGVSLWGQFQRIFEELVPECVERDTSIRWEKRDEDIKVFVDPGQFRYTLINVLKTVLSQVKPKSEIRVDFGPDGKVSMSYTREGSGTSPISSFLEPGSGSQEDEALPLRVLLARNLLERVGGGLEFSQIGDGRVQIKLVVPTAAPLN